MALQKHKIPIALDSGMDTKTDEFNAMSFKLVQNLKYTKSPGLIKRPGHDELSSSVTGIEAIQSDISSGSRLIGTANSMLLSNSTKTYHYMQESSSWKDISNDTNNYINAILPKCDFNTKNVFNNVNFVGSTSMGVTTKYNIYAALKDVNSSSTIGTKLLIKITSKEEDNLVYYKEINLSGMTTSAKVTVNVISDTYAMVIYNDVSSILNYVLITMNTPNIILIGSPTNIFGGVNPVVFDSIVYAGLVYVVFNDNTNTIYRYKYDESGIISTDSTVDASLSPSASMISICKYHSNPFFRVLYFNGGGSTTNKPIRHFGFSSTGVTTYSPTTLLAASASKIVNSAVAVSDGTNTYFFYNVSTPTAITTGTISSNPDNGDTYTTLYGTVLLDTNNSTVLSEVDIGTLQLIQSKPTIVNGNILLATVKVFGAAYTTAHQTAYMLSINPTTLYQSILAVIGYLEYLPAFLNTSNQALVNDSSVVYFPTVINKTVEAAPGGLFFTYYNSNNRYDAMVNVVASKFDFNVTTNSYVDTNKGTYIAGPLLKYYDGSTLSEASFVDTPFIYGHRKAGGGTITAGAYQFAVVARWTDGYGNIHRSVPYIATYSLGVDSVQLLIGGITVTNKEKVKQTNAMNNVVLEIYQTELSGTVLYLQDTIANVKFSNSFYFMANAAIKTDTEILYTQSGELENDAPTIGNYVTKFKNRIWTCSNGNVEYSKLEEENLGISFNEALKIPITTDGGDVVGIAGMDNVLAVFSRKKISIISGNGPNNQGQNDDYGPPQNLPTDTGCSESNSIVATPDGIMFKGDKGIYILNRGLYVSYIGAPVEAYNTNRILSAKLVENFNEVRFLLDNNVVLCYDYFYKKWNVETYTNVVDLAVLDKTTYLLSSAGKVLKENTAVYQDGSSYYSGKFESNWMTVGSITVDGKAQTMAQGFQRLYTINVLGKYKSAHNLKVSLAYNYNDTVVDYATIVPTGSGVYQFEVKPSIQKCESFKIIVEDINQSGSGESMVISHILLEVGIRSSAQKVVADSNRFPAT